MDAGPVSRAQQRQHASARSVLPRRQVADRAADRHDADVDVDMARSTLRPSAGVIASASAPTRIRRKVIPATVSGLAGDVDTGSRIEFAQAVKRIDDPRVLTTIKAMIEEEQATGGLDHWTATSNVYALSFVRDRLEQIGEGTDATVAPSTEATSTDATTASIVETPTAAKLPEPNVREAPWGVVVELLPGVGVEITGAPNPGYVEFIRGQLQRIMSTPSGAVLLGSFDPRAPGGREPQKAAPYTGLTVIVAPPPEIKPTAIKKTVVPAIKTEDVGPRKSATARDFNAPKMPRIQLHDLAKGEQTIGNHEGQPTSATFSPEAQGVTGHADFPNSAMPFDLVLYHEFVHAFLSHIGLAGRMREPELAAKLRIAQNADGAEEELVVGILAGKGLPMSENAFRCERGMTLRGSYKAVGITGDPALNKDPWKPSSAPAALVDAVRGLGSFSEQEAAYIATGKR